MQLKVYCRKKFGLQLVCQLPSVGRASPNFILQFTFSCNSLVHDLGLKFLFKDPNFLGIKNITIKIYWTRKLLIQKLSIMSCLVVCVFAFMYFEQSVCLFAFSIFLVYILLLLSSSHKIFVAKAKLISASHHITIWTQFLFLSKGGTFLITHREKSWNVKLALGSFIAKILWN